MMSQWKRFQIIPPSETALQSLFLSDPPKNMGGPTSILFYSAIFVLHKIKCVFFPEDL